MPALTHASTTETTRGITIYSVDFTSAPSRRKPLTYIHCDLSSLDLLAALLSVIYGIHLSLQKELEQHLIEERCTIRAASQLNV